jgi:hypothetical protein
VHLRSLQFGFAADVAPATQTERRHHEKVPRDELKPELPPPTPCSSWIDESLIIREIKNAMMSW